MKYINAHSKKGPSHTKNNINTFFIYLSIFATHVPRCGFRHPKICGSNIMNLLLPKLYVTSFLSNRPSIYGHPMGDRHPMPLFASNYLPEAPTSDQCSPQIRRYLTYSAMKTMPFNDDPSGVGSLKLYTKEKRTLDLGDILCLPLAALLHQGGH